MAGTHEVLVESVHTQVLFAVVKRCAPPDRTRTASSSSASAPRARGVAVISP
jgi:hypothetical protein